jgi:FHA domain
VGGGSYTCIGCGFVVTLASLDPVPVCSSCDGTRFVRASMFEQPTVDIDAIEVELEPGWLEETRDRLAGDDHEDQFLAFEGDEEVSVVRVPEGWTRIGRSASAEIRLDDPSVSRRHAVVVRTPEGDLRALDDRSLNGVFVNGDSVDWSALSDGDELAIGCYRLYVIDTTASPAEAGDNAPALNG